MKATIVIDTSQEYFCNWLEDFTRDAPYKFFPTEKGQISLQTARPVRYGYGGNRYMSMEGHYITTSEGETQSVYPISSVIEFKIIPLNQSRIEIMAECSQPVLDNYFQLLLAEISKRWPIIKSPERQNSELQEIVLNGFSEIKQGQSTLISIQEKLHQVIHDGQIEHGEMNRTLDAIRRALKYMQQHETDLSKADTEKVREANNIIESKIDLSEKLELTIPILPLLLSYKIELGVDNAVDIKDLLIEIRSLLHSLMEKPSKHGRG